MHGLQYLVSSFVLLLVWGDFFFFFIPWGMENIAETPRIFGTGGFLSPLASSIKITPKKAKLKSFQIDGICIEVLDIIQLTLNEILKVCIRLY